MVLKIIAIILGFLIGSLWLTVLIAAGVRAGLKNYFENKTSKEE